MPVYKDKCLPPQMDLEGSSYQLQEQWNKLVTCAFTCISSIPNKISSAIGKDENLVQNAMIEDGESDEGEEEED